jgi:chromate transport protein ChrA
MTDDDTTTPPPAPTFGEAVRYWLKLGCISFGGPAGQIAIMHKELVEKRRWISDAHFLHALELLHAPARPGGAATRHLPRLAAPRGQGRDRRGSAVS